MSVAFDSGLTAAVRIGACQPPEILGDVDAAVRCIQGFCGQAKRVGADLLLFPECFLQGYLVTEAHRKTHLTPGETLFCPGNEYPVFDVRGLRCGINICTTPSSPTRRLLVPAQNMMKRQAAETWKGKHSQIRATRARETGMWLISADVTGERGDTHIGYGPTSVMAPSGKVITQVPLMEIGMVTAAIPAP